MNSSEKGPEGCVDRVRENTQTYILELLEDNQKWRQRSLALESENEPLRDEAAALRSDMADLKSSVGSLRTECELFRAERQTLEDRLSAAEEESHRFSSRFVEVEQQNNNLASLYVASYQLHQTASRHEVLTALQEIIINLIGSEDFVIYERNLNSGKLSEAVSYGVEPARREELDLSSGPIAAAVKTGEMYLTDNLNADACNLVACIPMKMGDQVHGVIAILALLSHKEGLEPLDHEMFDLLASHAASSLYLSRLHAEAQAEVTR